MFQDVGELWTRYRDVQAPAWPPEDPRHDLSAEVRNRLEQLDIVLDHLGSAVRLVSPDPEQARKGWAWMEEAIPRLEAGEITEDEYVAGFPTWDFLQTDEGVHAVVRAWAEVHLFTEAFYLVAWRLITALRLGGGKGFPGFAGLRSQGITYVRNHLIEHPERHGSAFRQHLVLTDVGPVLKSTSVVVRSGTGRVEPESDSLDRGLLTNAQELHDELVKRLTGALDGQYPTS